jgi:hypothetical protein
MAALASSDPVNAPARAHAPEAKPGSGSFTFTEGR